ncbi:3-dehydroquinate synthase [Candidatus Chloroploca sp. M-50]|uniref:3-dehydroquinate synthase n=2 Tax=Candidatus Chloroploca mongolica TaxID=2528176 RepID=A0ABS4DB76_9CHLR|nr:3-dehydroquinate synthase [Candidatus Chloroploca mongolica]
MVTMERARYPVVVEAQALMTLPERLKNLGLRGTLWLVSDEAVAQPYAMPLVAMLRAAGFTVNFTTVPSGEASKSSAQLGLLYDWLIGGGVERRDAILALGGGVIGDLAGFAAASVLRGIAVIQLPTTLLAMVDAAVGGKTGINHPLGKNLIGAFHQPQLVLADTATLATLAPRELRAGWAEVIKHGVISDAGLFAELEALAAERGWSLAAPGGCWTPDDDDLTMRLTAIIRRAVAVKVGVVSRDEREQGERITLNYGHTIGHAVEALIGYGTLLHGEAVALGMHAAARIALAMNLCSADLVHHQQHVLGAYGLATTMPPELDPSAILALTLRDKKVQARRVRWVLPTAIGHVVIRDDVPEALVRDVLVSR